MYIYTVDKYDNYINSMVEPWKHLYYDTGRKNKHISVMNLVKNIISKDVGFFDCPPNPHILFTIVPQAIKFTMTVSFLMAL